MNFQRVEIKLKLTIGGTNAKFTNTGTDNNVQLALIIDLYNLDMLSIVVS
jgi:hypothetical protein